MITLALDLFDGTFWAGAGTTVAILLIGHWIPWRLPRLAAYAYGTASILLGVLVWLFAQRLYEMALGVWFIAAVGGLAVLAAYGVDWAIKYIRMGMNTEELLKDGGRIIDDDSLP